MVEANQDANDGADGAFEDIIEGKSSTFLFD